MRLLGHRPLHCSVVRMEVRVIPDLKFGRCECVSDLYEKRGDILAIVVNNKAEWLTLSRMTSSSGVLEAILAETEKRRRGIRPGRLRGSI